MDTNTNNINLRIYQLPSGRLPFLSWLHHLKDGRAVQAIEARIGRISRGNFGPTNTVGHGIHELKIDCGPGYRIYFRQIGDNVVILFCGGDKSTQNHDIQLAIAYWEDYKIRGSYADY